MKNLRDVLLYHAKEYPKMLPCDAVKLLYQSEFGCGHYITDFAACLKHTETEMLSAGYAPHDCEELYGSFCRLYLSEANRLSLSAKAVTVLFAASAAKCGSGRSFDKKLRMLEELTSNGLMPFDELSLADYLLRYDGTAVSHSVEYKSAYSPSYRVILCRLTQLIPLISEISVRSEAGKRTVVAIDGRCASGKTTTASMLCRIFSCPVIHCDDFFPPKGIKPEERVGNVDGARFKREVLDNLANGGEFSYRPYDCMRRDFKEPVAVAESDVVIVEGCYSTHPGFGDYADIKVFMTVSPEEQINRIHDRNGDRYIDFANRWIPSEEKYFSACKTKIRSDYVLEM